MKNKENKGKSARIEKARQSIPLTVFPPLVKITEAGSAPYVPEQYLSTQQVATMLNCTTRTVESLKSSGKLPFFRIGKKFVRFKRSEVEARLNDKFLVPAKD